MKTAVTMSFVFLYFIAIACSKHSTASRDNINHIPVAALSVSVTKVDPFTINCKVTASDEDHDSLTYTWDFGEGTTKQGAAEESFTYPQNKSFTIKVAITDGKSNSVNVSTTVNTTVTTITIDASQKYQVMEGFGGFGAKDVYWSNGPFTNPDFVNTLINDLGLTILRDNIPTDFEDVNDDNDPHTTDLSKFKYNSLNNHFQYLNDMRAAGLNKLIVSCWSAPAWMKTNGNVNGVKADAPAYNANPTAQDNQLRTDMYEEFAERCVAYIKVIRKETNIDVYGISLQNEPRFSEPYESSVFNGEALRDLIKVVGKRFKDEGLATKIFMPEDIGYLEGVSSMVQPTLNDAEARQYISIIAVHGYALDGVTADSPDAKTWQTMYSWGAQYNMPLWMTETSGYSNDFKGAMNLAKAMYTAINFGNVSAWLHWQISEQPISVYSLMSSSGEKSKRYFASKNFYRYVRPGTYRIKATTTDGTNIYPLAFKDDNAHSQAIILINDNSTTKAMKLTGAGLPSQLNMCVTSETDDCKDYGSLNTSEGIVLPANAVITLY